MAKKTEDFEDFVQEEVSKPAPAPVPQAVTVIAPSLRAAAPVREKTVSFEQWAKLRNKPQRHFGGLRAFLGEKAKNRYSLATWDDLFKAY